MFKRTVYLIFLLCGSVFAFQELPRVYTEPSLGYAEYERQDKAFKIIIKFWNVGGIYDKEHAVAKIISAGSECATGTFEGGPNGKFHFISNCDQYNPAVGKDFELNFQLIDGKRIPAKGLLTGDKNFTVTNPQIFANWDEDKKIDESAQQEIAVGFENGQFNGFEGEILVKEDENSPWKRAEANTIIKPGFHIKTGEDSTAKIRFPGVQNGDSVLGPKTEIKIHKPEEKSHWSILRGKIWNNIKKMWKDGTMEIDDTFQTGAVRGTTFVVEQTDGRSSIKLIDGSIECAPKNGKPTLVTTGNAFTSKSENDGVLEKFDVAAENAFWQSLENKTAAKPSASTGRTLIYVGIAALSLFVVLILLIICVLVYRLLRSA